MRRDAGPRCQFRCERGTPAEIHLPGRQMNLARRCSFGADGIWTLRAPLSTSELETASPPTNRLTVGATAPHHRIVLF